MSRSEDIFAFYPETVVMGPSLTVLLSPLPNQLSCTIKYGSGGTLFFFAETTNSAGCSYTTVKKYPFYSTEIFNFNGSGFCRLGVEGATTTFYINRGLSMGSTQL